MTWETIAKNLKRERERGDYWESYQNSMGDGKRMAWDEWGGNDINKC